MSVFRSVNIALEKLEEMNLEGQAWRELIDRGETNHWRSIALLQWEADDGNQQAKDVLDLLKIEIIRQRMLQK
jgi:hypothetical protein